MAEVCMLSVQMVANGLKIVGVAALALSTFVLVRGIRRKPESESETRPPTILDEMFRHGQSGAVVMALVLWICGVVLLVRGYLLH
jgi:hypothetical protein